MPSFKPENLLHFVLWVLATLSLQFLIVLLIGGWLQLRRNRMRAFRIRCLQRWEDGLVAFLFGSGETTVFQHLNGREQRLLIPFLARTLSTLAGSEGEAIVGLYRTLRLARGLDRRLRSRQAQVRALAALEVGSFFVESHYPRLLALLGDPVPHVAHAAARALAGTGRLEFAQRILDWVLTEEDFQLERLLWILEGFGPDFIPWLESRLDATPDPDPRTCMIYVLLAASIRNIQDAARIEAMLGMENLEVQAAAIKALGVLGHPDSLAGILPFALHESWILRAQAAKAIGSLAGPGAIPVLLDLLGDPFFAVRQNAARALGMLGPSGMEALQWLVLDATADPYARDLAREHLQWRQPRARAC